MEYVLYGAGGILLVLILLVLGVLIGWKGRGAWQEHTHRAVAKEATEEEKRQMEAEQKAFSGLLNYNMEIAYRMDGKGDE